MNIIVSGASGYIAKNFIDSLVHRTHILFLARIDPKMNNETLFDFLDDDFRVDDYEPGIIYHFGALAGINDCQNMPLEFLRKNVVCPLNSLNYFNRFMVSSGWKFVFISSCAVDNPNSSNYAASKYLVEQAIKETDNAYSYRLTNVYGGSYYGDKTSVVANWINRIKNGCSKLFINGNGEQRRNFVNVKHICDTLNPSIIGQLGQEYEPFTLAGKPSLSINTLKTIFQSAIPGLHFKYYPDKVQADFDDAKMSNVLYDPTDVEQEIYRYVERELCVGRKYA